MKTYKVVFELDEAGWWVASVPRWRGCHTQARTLRQARRRVREALSLYVDDVSAVRLVEDVRLPATAQRALAGHVAARARVDKERERALAKTQSAMRLLTERFGLSLRDAGELLGVSSRRHQQPAP